jgi:hypothetical protein
LRALRVAPVTIGVIVECPSSEVRAVGPRRKLQLSLLVAAALALLLALTGAVGPASISPVPGPATVVAP